MPADYDVVVVGLGYVGLPEAVAFARAGLRVAGVDVDRRKVEAVNSGDPGRCPHEEEALCAELVRAVREGSLRAFASYEPVSKAGSIVVAVPTPARYGIVDLSILEEAVARAGTLMRRGSLLVVASTVPPGTTRRLVARTIERVRGWRPEEDYLLAHAPERIAPGRSLEEIHGVPRLVGGFGPRSLEAAVRLYRRIASRVVPLGLEEAELAKLVENAYRDLNIAFANYVALVAERLGVDAWRVIEAANTHPRVGVHKPGAGVGGPCLTKDPYMLVASAPGTPGGELVTVARSLNDHMPVHTARLTLRALDEYAGGHAGARVGVLGAAYKGGVADTRESPAREVVRYLLGSGVEVVVHDPYTGETFGAQRAESVEDAARGADALVIVTDHPEYRSLDLAGLARLMRHRIVVDGRGLVRPEEALRAGMILVGVGRPWPRG